MMEPRRVNIEGSDNSYYVLYSEDKKTSPGVINMFGYCRVSPGRNGQTGIPVLDQIYQIEDVCRHFQYDDNNRRFQYNLMRIYVDDGISSDDINNLPGYKAMKEHINSVLVGMGKRKTGIIMSDISRLTKNSDDVEHFIAWIKEGFIRLKLVNDNVSLSTASGKIIARLIANYYDEDQKTSSSKTRETLRIMSEEGTLTGHCSYGWTTGVDENGKKINVPVEEEQEGLREVIRIYEADPEQTPTEIKHLMNESGIRCLRGPGKNFRGKTTEKGIKRNEGTPWTGEWTTQIIEKIIERHQLPERKRIVEELRKDKPVDIRNRDEITIDIIRNYLIETNQMGFDNYNFSEMARMVNDTMTFCKPVERRYVKRLMESSGLVPVPEVKTKTVNEEDVLKQIQKIIDDRQISTCVALTDALDELNVPLLGKRQGWNQTNVRTLLKKHSDKLKLK